MRQFKVDDSSFAKRIEDLAASQSEEQVDDAFARATLSLITEPGDRFAGVLTQVLSASKLLEFELTGGSTSSLQTLLKERGALEEVQALFPELHESHREARERWTARLNLGELSNALDAAIRVNSKLLTPESDYWPANLDHLQFSTPHCLWVRGVDLEPFAVQPAISIVGSRVSSSYGEWVASEIVTDCSVRGLAIVSGGAYGIDAIAHRSSLAQGQYTVAFMAGGIDRLYPSGNAELLERIAKNGAIVAEQAPGASPTKWRFLQRNRLIAALGAATVVVEAGARSGALNTVTHAQELGRPVGAVPGAITAQGSAGCNRLIAQAAAEVICKVSDAANLVFGEAGWFQPELYGLGALETRALDAMSDRAQADMRIASRAGLTHKEVAIALGQLSLLGFVEQRDKGWVKLPLEREQSAKTIGN